MAGGLFAVERKYFFEIGAYDDQVIEPQISHFLAGSNSFLVNILDGRMGW
jgi:hypothetical protein